MTHEMRTPLNGIIGFSELMYDGKLGEVNAIHKEFLQDILASSRYLLRVLSDIIDLTDAQSRILDLQEELTDLKQLIAKVGEMLAEEMAKKEITLHLRVDETLAPLLTDPEKLRQVLYHCVSNAVKFSHEKSKIEIRVDSRKSRNVPS